MGRLGHAGWVTLAAQSRPELLNHPNLLVTPHYCVPAAQLACEVVRAAHAKGLQPPKAASLAERLRDAVTGIVCGPCRLLYLRIASRCYSNTAK
jgi:hypothetical protein